MNRCLQLVVIACVAIVGPSALAQNTRERPSRGFAAETQAAQRRFAGTVRNERIDPEWLAPGRVIYRLDEADGGWRYLVCDAETGAVAAAFDHVAVAEGLAQALGRDVAPDRLPLARFAVTDRGANRGAYMAMLSPDVAASTEHPVVSIRGGTAAFASEPPAAFRAAPVTRRASGSGPPTYLLVNNRGDAPVRLFWLDAGGEARPYETIAPRSTSVRTTFTGHVWSLRVDGREVARVAGERRPSIVTVAASSKDGAAAEDAADAGPDRQSAARAPEDAQPARPSGRGPGPRLRVRDHNVVLVDGDRRRRLTEDGDAAHGFGGRIQMSPAGSRGVVMKTRRVETRTIHFIESSPPDQVQPRLHEMTYAKPGDPRNVPVPWVFDVASGEGRPVDADLIGQPWSLSDVHWIDESRFRLRYNERGHAVVRVVEFDAISGAGRTVVEEASDTFVDYPNKIFHRRLADGRQLWMSQRTGWNHLYLLDGETGDVIRPLTAGEWLVRSVDAVDETAGIVQLTVLGIDPAQDPYHRHHVRVDIETGQITRLTGGDGTHEIERSPDGAYYLARYERVDLPPVTELRRWSDGSRVAELARADATDLTARGWRAPERFSAPGRDGTTDIWGVIFRPADFDPTRRYPVVEQIYAGPHGHFVPKTWRVWHGARELAERGFVVVQIDGMGTNWRSKAFHDVAHRNLGDSGFPDRIAWMRAAAAERPWMDLERVGIYGGSAGGQSATRALIAHGDFYRAAVSDCGCHDNRVDKIWWNELWMDYPIGPHYAEQSNVDQAHRITGDLLLIVGEMDRNVDPASTMQVVDALIKADKDFELLVIPGAGHGAAGSPYGRRRQAEFFARTLGGPVE